MDAEDELMDVTIESGETLEGLLGGIYKRMSEGWRLYGTPFVVGKEMCEKLPDGIPKKGKRICIMLVRNVGDGV